MPFDPSTFRSILGRFAAGVTVVTARDDAETDHGMTVSAFCSLSLEPPLVLMSIDQKAVMHGVLSSAAHCAVNVLSSGQESLARHFAEKLDDRFDGIGYTRGITGAALLKDVLAHIECNVVDRCPGGDHTIFICEVVAAEAYPERPLLYYRGGYAQLER
jgi:flavin reductase (DIM6/NTAB) family NADH-FMN oxidoreductase RutF